MGAFHSRRKWRQSRRRRRVNLFPFLIFLGIIALFIWAVYHFFAVLFSHTRAEALSAEIKILKGRAEFSLAESSEWTPAYSEQRFFTGDSLRTKANSKIVVEITGGNTLFLGENAELNFEQLEQSSPEEKEIAIKLLQGDLWSRVPDDQLAHEEKTNFEVFTDRIILKIKGTIFALSAGAEEDIVRLIRGSIDAQVPGEEKDRPTISIGVGQKLVVNSPNLQKIKNGMEVLEILDSDFIESEWHIKNLEQFYPQEAAQIRRRIELSAASNVPKTTEENTESQEAPPTPAGAGILEAPQILSPQNGATISKDEEIVKIEGTAPSDATQIVVNGFTLTKYQPGDRKWSYFAAKKFGTLVPGENTFSAHAVARDGRASAKARLTIIYEGSGMTPSKKSTTPPPPTSTAVKTKSDKTSTGAKTAREFSAPRITKPAVLSKGGVYETSADVVTMMGEVDPTTNMIKVNGYKLKKYRAGDTEFAYIASSRYGKRSNLKEGENNYEIIAYGPYGKQASTKVKVFYTPVKVSQ